jgi:diacylglycerol kinase (ATP)
LIENSLQSNTQQSENITPRKVFVVFNPVAGLTKADDARQQIERYCHEHDWDCQLHETVPDEDLRKLVQDALESGVDLVIASGGDGTVSGVVTGMIGSQKPMAILPGGTGNALARDLKIPLNLEAALELLNGQNRVQALDVMQTNGNDYFVLNVSVGISSLTMRTTARDEKRRFGMLAYARRAVQSMARADLHRFTAVVDGQEYRFAASEVMITNTRFLGLQPQIEGVVVEPNDGVVDLFIVRARSLGDYLAVSSRLFFPKKPNEDIKLTYLPIREHASIWSEFPLPVQADGEEIGITPLELRLIPSALRVLVPEAG